MSAAVLAGLTVACGTEPDGSFRVAVSAPERVAVVPTSPSQGFGFSCEIPITARAEGGGAGDYAVWESGSVDVQDGAIFRPVVSWNADEVAAFFGADRISAGGEQRGSARVSSGAAQFPVTYAFRYRLASREAGTASVTTVCE